MIVERLDIPTTAPFQLQAVKAHIRYPSDREDGSINTQARAAALELEQYAQLALLTQTVRVTLEDGWPTRAMMPLPVAPLIDPLSPTATVDGVAFDGFAVIAGLRPALRLSGDRPSGVMVITYEAGFGPSASDIPDDLQLAIMDQLAATFEVRGLGNQDTKITGNWMSPHMARIAARYRRVAL